ncbi:MAG: hypothetical protein MRZ79_08005 [Bacteroidia bacterium]|nr:hypothetical protein [Bacteroidia bacterium]
MKYFLYMLGILCFIGILMEDFRSRKIHIGWFIGTVIFGISGILLKKEGWILDDLTKNIVFVSILLASTYTIFKIRKRGKFIDRFMGLGDVVMLYCLSLWLDPMGLYILFIGSTCITVFAVGLLAFFKKIEPENYPIPLAGIWSICFILMLGKELLIPEIFKGGMLW